MGTLLIETKENSPEKLAAIAGKDTKYFFMAEELNDIVEAITVSEDKITVLQGLQNLKTNFTGPAFAIWTGVGLIYDVIYPDFYLEGVLYPGATEQVTLPAAHNVYDRKDIIAVNALGAFSIQGEPEEVALAPTFDTNTVIYISTADVAANSTVPGNVSEKVVFKENSEFTTFSNSGAINFNSNLSPFQGAIHIDCTSVSAGNTMKFTDSVLNSITDYSLFRFFVSLKSVFSNSTRFYVRFLKDGIAVSSTVEIVSGNYNFNRNTVNMYQGVIIPITAFSFTNSQFNGVEIFMYGSNASGFRMDNIILSKGETATSPTQKAITSIVTDSGVVNATVADDTIEMKSANSGLAISAVGKIITFTSLFTAVLKGYYDTAYAWVYANGAAVMTHLSRIDNPHNVTAAQVGADKDVLPFALSAPTGALVTGDTDSFPAPYNFTLVTYWISVHVPPTLSSLIVDIKKNGTSITSTKAAIDATEKNSLTGTSPVLTTTSFAKGDEITPNIFAVGSGVTGESLKIYLEVIKT